MGVAHPHLAPDPRTTDVDRRTRPRVTRLHLLEERQDVLGAQCCPLREKHVVLVSQGPTPTSSDQSRVTHLRENRHESIVPDVRVSAAAPNSGMRASHYGIRHGTMDLMSTQIAVRLPDEMVAFLDRAVASGQAPSRAAVVASAVEREMRRLLAEQDAQVLRQQGSSDDLDDLVRWTTTHVDLED